MRTVKNAKAIIPNVTSKLIIIFKAQLSTKNNTTAKITPEAIFITDIFPPYCQLGTVQPEPIFRLV